MGLLDQGGKHQIDVAAASGLGHGSLSHWFCGDPFSALRLCQKLSSLRGVALSLMEPSCEMLFIMHNV